MLSKKSVSEFFDSPVSDYYWLKDLEREDLLSFIEELQPNPIFKTNPFTAQLAGFILGIDNSYCNLPFDMGTGKSKIILDIISYRKLRGDIKRALIISPNAPSIMNWYSQVEEHSDLTATPVMGARKKRWDTIKNNIGADDICLLNYHGLLPLGAYNPDERKRSLNKESCIELASMFDLIVYDEIHNIKNKNTITFKVCEVLSKNIKYRYGLTGTPFSRNLEDLWSQRYAIDLGETLNNHITPYREKYFTKVISHWGGYDYKFKKKLETHLNKRLRHISLRYSAEEVTELPERVDTVLDINLSSEGMKYYKDVLAGLIKAEFKVIEIRNAFVRLRQICSGFVGFVDEDTDEKRVIEFSKNPKLDLLKSTLESVPHDRYIVIFNEFVPSGNMIEKMLKKAKIKYIRLYGGTKDKAGAVSRFTSDPECKVFLAQNASGSSSLNLQKANYVFFYESPVSAIIRAQAEKRCDRTGQKNTVFLYDFVTKNSIEQRIISFVKEGKDLFNTIIANDPLKALGID